MSSSDIDELFPPEYLKKLEGLSLIARQIARGQHRSERKSSLRGVSPEFSEFRSYIPGDDMRYIDWNAYARWRHLALKLFVEERDLPVYLLVDCTGSMDWGSPNKHDYVRRVAAGLAHIALAQNDRVGVFPIGGDPENRNCPAARGRDRQWEMLRALAESRVARHRSHLHLDIERWVAMKPQRGLVLWLSDLWGEDEHDVFHALDRLRHSRHEVAVLQIYDHGESSAGAPGERMLESVESGERRVVIVDSKMRAAHSRIFQRYQESLRNYCRRNEMPLIQTDTRLSETDLLMLALRERGFAA